MKTIPEWLAVNFTVKRVPNGYLLMDGDTPVSGHPFATLTSANSCLRDCQERREIARLRFGLR